jgi:hypothetical protein
MLGFPKGLDMVGEEESLEDAIKKKKKGTNCSFLENSNRILVDYLSIKHVLLYYSKVLFSFP